MTKSSINLLSSLPIGYRWVYPKKGETVNGLKGRHAVNDNGIALSFRQVSNIAHGKADYTDVLAKTLGTKKTEEDVSKFKRVKYSHSYYFTNADDAYKFTENLKANNKTDISIIWHGENSHVDDSDKDADIIFRSSLDTYKAGRFNTTMFKEGRAYKRLRSQINGSPEVYVKLYEYNY